MSWQFSIAGSKNVFLEFRYDTNRSFPGAVVHVWPAVGRVINSAKFANSVVKNAVPVVGSIYRPVVSKHLPRFSPQTVELVSISSIFCLHVRMSSELRFWYIFRRDMSSKAPDSKTLARAWSVWV